jgi:hypothetical protein
MKRSVLFAAVVTAVSLTVSGAGASPGTIRVSPSAIDFHTKAVGRDYYDSVKITNASSRPLVFLVEAGLPDDFGFGLMPGSTCPVFSPGATLQPNESCKAVVRFTPTAYFVGSLQRGSLIVTATDPSTGTATTVSVPVIGTGK